MILIKSIRSTTRPLLLCLLLVLSGVYACDRIRSDLPRENPSTQSRTLYERPGKNTGSSANLPDAASTKQEKHDTSSAQTRTTFEQPEVKPPRPAALPDFASIQNVTKRKKRFFEFLQPLVRAENDSIRRQRGRLLALHDTLQQTGALSASGRTWLRELCAQYSVSPDSLLSESTFQKLLLRVDTVPLELALVQGAIESGWGRSRFAVRANNLFGQWCFEQDCGIVPAYRSPGSKHEVAIFPTPRHSVRAYIRNLNTYYPYFRFRLLRREKRLAGERPDGHTLAAGLQQYSSTRMEYVRKLRTILRQNKNLLPIPDKNLAVNLEESNPSQESASQNQ